MGLFGKKFLPGLTFKNIGKAIKTIAPIVASSVGLGAVAATAVDLISKAGAAKKMAAAAARDGVVNTEKVVATLQKNGVKPTQEAVAAVTEVVKVEANKLTDVNVNVTKEAHEVANKASLWDKIKSFVLVHKMPFVIGGVVVSVCVGAYILYSKFGGKRGKKSYKRY